MWSSYAVLPLRGTTYVRRLYNPLAHVLKNHIRLITCFEKSYLIGTRFDKIYPAKPYGRQNMYRPAAACLCIIGGSPKKYLKKYIIRYKSIHTINGIVGMEWLWQKRPRCGGPVRSAGHYDPHLIHYPPHHPCWWWLLLRRCTPPPHYPQIYPLKT